MLLPLLSAGAWVLLDRFVDSSLAYQGGGRGLGVEEVAELNRFATAGLVPDRTLFLRLDPELGRARQHGRGEGPDRLEQEDESFFAAIALAYETLAAAEPERIRVIDAAARRTRCSTRARGAGAVAHYHCAHGRSPCVAASAALRDRRAGVAGSAHDADRNPAPPRRMVGVFMRLPVALAVAFVVLIAPAHAQVPTPTPTPTVTPAPRPRRPTPTPDP